MISRMKSELSKLQPRHFKRDAVGNYNQTIEQEYVLHAISRKLIGTAFLGFTEVEMGL
jgi:hypothetical protein